ncbi:LysR family transcriptional regulator [Pluralibacter gergoviae]|uniref:LysR family transcriptional regulator n=1 Tax=Pluralibacter gergoviae TaxID=61647 RepID=UPI0004F6C21F|nr:LysR family transcriptional regulator [Pluralibacter gergoviae]AIR02475.1 LysR family transcriptional regulator [Pluralibacter gergoviae]
MTFKQLEASYWVVTLGGFQHAARKLHTTQSAISKRVQELESFLGIAVFDRNHRSVSLTEKGEELFIQAKKLLAMRLQVIEQVSSPEIFNREIVIGVTELTALTWLPRLIGLIQQHYPRVNIESDVDMSINLQEKLLADEIDLAIVPDAFHDPRFSRQPVGKVKNVWMCKPDLCAEAQPRRLYDLHKYRLLMDKSGPGIIYGRWFEEAGFTPPRKLISNSIVALLSLTVSGGGISYFPESCLEPLTRMGILQQLDIAPALPDITYVAMHKVQRHSELISSIIMLAQNCCDFKTILQRG